MKTTLTIILIAIPLYCLAERTIRGQITDKNGNPISNARVRAFDNDWPGRDQSMGTTFTDTNGNYQINYSGGHWDSAPHSITTWRPDIYIKVSIRVNGRCDGGKWNEGARWKRISQSKEYTNQRLREDLTINIRASNYPEENITRTTFTECENMICSFDFFFHYHCTGCFNGGKVKWSSWGTSLPYSATRCINLDQVSECNQRDRDNINRECTNRFLDFIGARSGLRVLQENCIGAICNQLRYIDNEEKKEIVVINESKQLIKLNFKARPFKNWKKMRIVHKLKPNDSLSIPSINYIRLKAKTYSLKDN